MSEYCQQRWGSFMREFMAWGAGEHGDFSPHAFLSGQKEYRNVNLNRFNLIGSFLVTVRPLDKAFGCGAFQ
jgi:hypothetical protein